MLCLFKNHITSFGLFCLLFLSVLVSLFLDTNVSALEISQTYTANTFVSRGDPIFTNCNDYNCLSQFKYLKIETTGNQSLNLQFYDIHGFWSYTTGLYVKFIILGLEDFNPNGTSKIGFNQNYTFSYDFTFTLSDSICPACPDPEPAPDPPDCPEVPDNPYDDKLDNITQAIYVATATLLVIYFFYCIYRMIIKGVKQ